MIQKAAPTSTAIKVVTFFVCCLAVFFIILGLSQPVMLISAALMWILIYVLFLYAPVAYEIKDNTLIIHRRVKKKVIEGVTGASLLETNFPKSIRTWGNGGLFSASGRFYNRTWGTFYAYVTNHKHPNLLVVETKKFKILISPANPQEFKIN